MRKLVASFFLVGAICFATWTSNGAVTFADDDSDAAVVQADTALQIALKRKDAKSLGALLDQQFSWTSESGQSLTSAQFVRDAAAGTVVGDTEYNNVKGKNYGQLAIVTGVGKRTDHEGAVFARIWVKRSAGWLLLTHLDTPILAKGTPSLPLVVGKGAPSTTDCDNPCRSLPYTPKTAEQKEVVKAYQATELAVVTHDDKTWAKYVADEFVGIGRRYLGSPDTKAARVGQIGIGTNHVIVPRMLWAETFVFGTAALMIAEHEPVGEPPYHVIRLYLNRDGRWQLVHRQETTIKGAPPARDKLNQGVAQSAGFSEGLRVRHIFLYGDSLSWGIVPNTRKRFSFDERWPGILENKLNELGHRVRMIEDCLNGRRTVWEDPFKPGRNGMAGLAQRMEIHSPLALVILMLGTNDFQFSHPYNNAWSAAQGIATLVREIRKAPIEPGIAVPPILVVCPPPISTPKGVLAEKFSGGDQKCAGLGDAYRSVCSELGCHFFDAASVTSSSRVDGIHLDADQHRALGLGLVNVVAKIVEAANP